MFMGGIKRKNIVSNKNYGGNKKWEQLVRKQLLYSNEKKRNELDHRIKNKSTLKYVLAE
jgi:hypothetical protein